MPPGTYYCKTCNHPRRDDIERDLLNGMRVSDVARKYGNYASNGCITNHKQKHMNNENSSKFNSNITFNDIKQCSNGVIRNIDVSMRCPDHNGNQSSQVAKTSLVTGEKIDRKFDNADVEKVNKLIERSGVVKDLEDSIIHWKQGKSIDELIQDNKVKSIVLETLKELGYR